MLLTDAPGIGIEIDENLLQIAKTTYQPRNWPMPIRTDGSVAYAV